MRILMACLALIGGALVVGHPAPAHAQFLKTWVSASGDDANNCSRAAPCQSLVAAMGKTSAGGEISCIDANTFASMTISKSLIIDCTGAPASLSSAVNGVVTVNAGANDVVILRGLQIRINNSATAGIQVLSAGRVTISDVRIVGAVRPAIVIEPRTATRVDIMNSILSNNTGGGIYASGSDAQQRVSVTNVQSVQNLYGMRIDNSVRAVINNSTFTNNTNNGLLVFSSGEAAIAWANASAFSNNGVNGVATSGDRANVRLSNSQVTGNANGLNFSGGGLIASTNPSSNAIFGNEAMNAPNGTVPLQ